MNAPAKNIPEGEVALRFAIHVLSECDLATKAVVSIDGAAAKCVPILKFLTGEGWKQVRQTGKNDWGGSYMKAGTQIEVHSRPGEGDVIIDVGGRRLVAECKKGPRTKSGNGQERRLLAEVIGQAAKWDWQSGDLVFVAVPCTDEFQRVAGDWLKSDLFRRTDINIALVGENGSAVCQHRGTSMKLKAFLQRALTEL